jgi:hypothetical protein
MPPRAQRRAERMASVGEAHFRSTDELLTAIERKRIIPVPQAAAINNLSTDTFTRKYRHLIKRVSDARVGVELGDALDIPKPLDVA